MFVDISKQHSSITLQGSFLAGFLEYYYNQCIYKMKKKLEKTKDNSTLIQNSCQPGLSGCSLVQQLDTRESRKSITHSGFQPAYIKSQTQPGTQPVAPKKLPFRDATPSTYYTNSTLLLPTAAGFSSRKFTLLKMNLILRSASQVRARAS